MRQRLLRLAALLLPSAVHAQPADLPIAPATTSEYPPGVKVVKTAAGPVYANARGQVLYGMDMRVLMRFGPDPAQFCQSSCVETWEPLLAPAAMKPNIQFPRGFGPQRQPLPPGFVTPQSAPDWSVIAGPQGPQWTYKGWHMVFIRKGDKPGTTSHDGADAMAWNTLKFVPPVPVIAAPAGIKPLFAQGAYALASSEGRLLFSGECKADCASWTPLAGGLANRGLGEWRVITDGDTPQWAWRGKPVFVASADSPDSVPAGAKVLRP